MKKKHLSSLNALERWLAGANVLTEDLKISLQALKRVVNLVEEAQGSTDLPLPAEIAHEPQTIALYSDGGCRGNPGPGAFAYLAQDHSGAVVAQGVEFEGLTTNNKMELGGALRGLQELAEILPSHGRDSLLTKVKVMTDSKYVVDGMKSWLQGWKARGWKKADNKAPENLELWQGLDEIRNRFMEVEWVWVKGHAGHAQNEYCDKKANEAMDENGPGNR